MNITVLIGTNKVICNITRALLYALYETIMFHIMCIMVLLFCCLKHASVFVKLFMLLLAIGNHEAFSRPTAHSMSVCMCIFLRWPCTKVCSSSLCPVSFDLLTTWHFRPHHWPCPLLTNTYCWESVDQWSSIFLSERNPLERLDRSQNLMQLDEIIASSCSTTFSHTKPTSQKSPTVTAPVCTRNWGTK